MKTNFQDLAGRLKPNARTLSLRQTPFWVQFTGASISILGITALTTSFIYRIDEVLTLSGLLESTKGSVEITSPVGGKVSKVFVSDGDFVEKGQKLILIDSRDAQNKINTTNEVMRLEKKNYQQSLSLAEEQLKVLKQRIKTTEYLVGELEGLTQQGGFQKMQYLQTLDTLFEYKANLHNQEIKIESIRLDHLKTLAALQNEINEAQILLQYKEILAPKSGVIFDLQASNEGTIQPAKPLVKIIPQDSLNAKVFIPNSDISTVKVGQKASIRINAYPYTRYGQINGKVLSIGADALEPDQLNQAYRYPATLSLKTSYLEKNGIKYPLKSGMAITVNIKLRDKPVISLITDMFSFQKDSLTTIRDR